MSMRERKEIQEVLWRLNGADHAASVPGLRQSQRDSLIRNSRHHRATRSAAELDEAVSLHGLQRPGEVRFLSPRQLRQPRERFGGGFCDDPKQRTIAVGQNPSVALSRSEPDLRFIRRRPVLASGDRQGPSFHLFISGNPNA